jgi:hypothetical protein
MTYAWVLVSIRSKGSKPKLKAGGKPHANAADRANLDAAAHLLARQLGDSIERRTGEL